MNRCRWATALMVLVFLLTAGVRLESGVAASDIARITVEPNVLQLLDSMASIYASCLTYQDSGVAVSYTHLCE